MKSIIICTAFIVFQRNNPCICIENIEILSLKDEYTISNYSANSRFGIIPLLIVNLFQVAKVSGPSTKISSRISTIFWIFHNIKCFITWYFIRKCSSKQILQIYISYIMLKVSFVEFVSIDILWISRFFEFLYSFFVAGKCFTNTMRKSRLSSMHIRHDFIYC